MSPDFRIHQNPAKAGVFVRQALSFGQHPTGLVRLTEPASMPLGQLADASTKRLHIETSGDFLLEPHNAFLTRRLYTDSARLVIKQLHG
ncbi:MAG: hypothetical protein D4R64_15000 [Porphyromonadaceae bacterium]|nr:MAG: hypothetical protein D4R64_15000 [Porphyromonadaceae bacterium]